MSLVKFILSFISLAYLLAPPVVSAKELKMGYFFISPHIIRSDNGIPVGSAVDWFNQYIAPHINETIVWEPQGKPLPRLLLELESGNTDIAILFAKRPDRETYLFYPKKPYHSTQPALLVKNDFFLDKIQRLDEVKSSTIGFGIEAYIPPEIKAAGLNFELLSGNSWQKQNVLKLMAGRIDAMFDPQEIVLKYLAIQHGVADQTKVLTLPVNRVPNYTVFSKKTTDLSLVKQYEKAFDSATSIMPYRRFFEQWKDPKESK